MQFILRARGLRWVTIEVDWDPNYRRGRMLVDVKYRAIREHKRSYGEGIRLGCGEVVEVGRRDIRWSSWLWCTTASGAGAWIPEQFLNILDQTRAVVTTDYNSIELPVTPDEMVTGTQALDGWIWCQNAQSEEGWVPLDNLQSAGDRNPLQRADAHGSVGSES